MGKKCFHLRIILFFWFVSFACEPHRLSSNPFLDVYHPTTRFPKSWTEPFKNPQHSQNATVLGPSTVDCFFFGAQQKLRSSWLKSSRITVASRRCRWPAMRMPSRGAPRSCRCIGPAFRWGRDGSNGSSCWVVVTTWNHKPASWGMTKKSITKAIYWNWHKPLEMWNSKLG